VCVCVCVCTGISHWLVYIFSGICELNACALVAKQV